MSERRSTQRFPVRDCVVECAERSLLHFLKKPSLSTFPLIDISGGGLQMLANKVMKAGLKLHLGLAVPGEKNPVKCTGKVMWSKKFPQKVRGQEFFGVGIKFLAFDGADRDRFAELLRSGRFRAADFTKIASAMTRP